MSSCVESCNLCNVTHMCMRGKNISLYCGEPVSYAENTCMSDEHGGNVCCHALEFFTWYCVDCYKNKSSNCEKGIKFMQEASYHSFTEGSFYCGAPPIVRSAIQLNSNEYGVLKVKVELTFSWTCVACSKRD